MKKILILFLLLVASSVCKAFVVDGISYVKTGISRAKVGSHSQNSNLTSVIIPSAVDYNDEVYYIDNMVDEAFAFCSNLSKTTINCDTISKYAFYGCKDLTSVTIEHGVKRIDNMAFYICSSLKSVSFANVGAELEYIGKSAFYGTSITSIELPNSVKEIGALAFENCTKLSKVSIPASVTNIHNSAFSGCTSLSTVYCLAKNVPQSNGYNPFENTDLTKATLYVPMESVEAYKNADYWRDFGNIVGTNILDASSITVDGIYYNITSQSPRTVQVSQSPTTYGNSTYTIPQYVTYKGLTYTVTGIGEHAFNGSYISSLVIPNTVTSIGYRAFNSCSRLTSISIPNSVKSIGEDAFRNSGIKSLELPYSVKTIGGGAFRQCSSLESVVIPKFVTEIGYQAFYNCKKLTSIQIEDGNVKYDSRNNCNAIIETESNKLIQGCINTNIPNSVTSIGQTAFAYCPFTSYTIPNSVTELEPLVFYNCASLETVTIPSTVKTVGDQAFYGCTNLSTVYCYSKQVPQGDGPFNNCRLDYATLYVPKGSIDTYKANTNWNGFWKIIEMDNQEPDNGNNNDDENDNITSFNVDGIYYNVTSSSDMTIEVAANPDKYEGTVLIPATVSANGKIYTVTSIGVGAFYECSKLTSVSIPSSVTGIEKDAFRKSGITSIELPYSIKEIGGCAFYSCSSLKSIFIPKNVTGIGYQAFYNCKQLTSIEIEDGNIKYDSRDNCNAIIETESNKLIQGCVNTNIPNSVTCIGRTAFAYCPFTSFSIPNSITVLEPFVFYKSSLHTVTIPSSVTIIGDQAFDGCIDLSTVYCYAKDVPEGINPFKDCGIDEAVLYVLKGSESAYRENQYWNGFWQIYGVKIIVSSISINPASASLTIGEQLTLNVTVLPEHATNKEIQWESSDTTVATVDENGKVTAINAGTATITATTTDGTNLSASCIVNVTANEQFACYLQNVQTGKFIDQGNNYGTTITLGHGIDLVATKTNNGTYVFDTRISYDDSHWLSEAGFVDAGYSEYVVNDLGDGVCTIKTLDGRALTAHEGNTVVGFEEENGAWSQWRMLSKEQMMANLQNTPADATWMIDDPNFSRNNTRVSSWKEDNGNTPVKGGEEYNFNAERWGGNTGTFDIYQQLTDIPNGVYEISVQGYYRYNETDDNNNDFVIAAHANGTEQIFAFVYANGAEVALPSVADDDAVRELGFVPLYQWEASDAFSRGLYTRKLFVEVTDGTLRVGIKKTNHLGCDWTVFDNFELTYLGAKESLKCGDNINWWFDAATSTLTLTGTGYMAGTKEALSDFNTQIEHVVIGEGILGTSWDSFVGCKNVASAKLPESLVYISGSTFNGCTKLASIDIPANVETIDPWAFAWTGISSVVLPKSVANIGDNVFHGCSNLNDVTCFATEVPETNAEAFGDVDLSNATLHVPEFAYTDYAATKPWSDFGNIVKIEGDDEATGDIPVTDIANMPNVVYINEIEVNKGAVVEIPVLMKNEESIAGFEFNLSLPDEFTVSTDEDDEYLIELSEERTTYRNHNIFDFVEKPDGTIYVLCNSSKSKVFEGNDGEIARVTIKVAENAQEGEYPVVFKNVMLADSRANNIKLGDLTYSIKVRAFIPGDANGDGEVTGADITAIANHLLGYPNANFEASAADANGDGEITGADITAVANLLLYGNVRGNE